MVAVLGPGPQNQQKSNARHHLSGWKDAGHRRSQAAAPIRRTISEHPYTHTERSSSPSLVRICEGRRTSRSCSSAMIRLTNEPDCEALGHRARVAVSLATIRLRTRTRTRLQGARRHHREGDHDGDAGRGRGRRAPRALAGREHVRSLDPRWAQAPRPEQTPGPRARPLRAPDPQVAARPRVGRARRHGSRIDGEVHARRAPAPARRCRVLQGELALARRSRARAVALRDGQELRAHRASQGALGSMGSGPRRTPRRPLRAEERSTEGEARQERFGRPRRGGGRARCSPSFPREMRVAKPRT